MSLVSLSDLLKTGNERGAVGSFSTYDLFTAQGVIDGAENTELPVIVMVGAPVLEKAGNSEVGKLIVRLAEQAKVPVAVLLDHAKTFESCAKAIRLGFSAVMIDGSHLDFEENIKMTKKVIEMARPLGVSVEGELGALAGVEDGQEAVSAKMTNPLDVPRFIDATGVDALAISIGNAHGLYRGIPKLDFDILTDSFKLTDTPLVLHGGTGIETKQFAKAIQIGIRKINIGTEVKRAFTETFIEMHAKNQAAYDLVNIPQACKQAVTKVAENNLKLFASDWKSLIE